MEKEQALQFMTKKVLVVLWNNLILTGDLGSVSDKAISLREDINIHSTEQEIQLDQITKIFEMGSADVDKYLKRLIGLHVVVSFWKDDRACSGPFYYLDEVNTPCSVNITGGTCVFAVDEIKLMQFYPEPVKENTPSIDNIVAQADESDDHEISTYPISSVIPVRNRIPLYSGTVCQNAIVENVNVLMQNERIHIEVYLKYANGAQMFGSHILYLGESYVRHDSSKMMNYAGHFLYKLFRITDSTTLDQVKGKAVRAYSASDRVVSIGHILEDIWFCPEEDFRYGFRALYPEFLEEIIDEYLPNEDMMQVVLMNMAFKKPEFLEAMKNAVALYEKREIKDE